MQLFESGYPNPLICGTQVPFGENHMGDTSLISTEFKRLGMPDVLVSPVLDGYLVQDNAHKHPKTGQVATIFVAKKGSLRKSTIHAAQTLRAFLELEYGGSLNG